MQLMLGTEGTHRSVVHDDRNMNHVTIWLEQVLVACLYEHTNLPPISMLMQLCGTPEAVE